MTEDHIAKHIDDVKLLNRLIKINIKTVGDLLENQDKILNTRGIGQKSCMIIDEYLGTHLYKKKQELLEKKIWFSQRNSLSL